MESTRGLRNEQTRVQKMDRYCMCYIMENIVQSGELYVLYGQQKRTWMGTHMTDR